MQVNVHQLELFYYVGRYGGFTQAARKMPYGIDPSSLSRQLCRLEREAKALLYERRSFKLTPAGEQLFARLQPVFENLAGVMEGLGKDLPEVVRLAASPVVLHDYLPPILRSLKRSFPQVRVTCNEGSQKQIESWLKDKVIDLAITLMEGSLPREYEAESLVELPLVLLVRARSKIRSADDLWRKRPMTEQRVGLDGDHPFSRVFDEQLRRRGIEWPLGLAANTIELVETYVSKGLGVGVSVGLPGRSLLRSGLRTVPLPNFPRVPVGMVWLRSHGAAIDTLLAEFRRASKKLLRAK